MPPKHRVIPMKFDTETWADALELAADDGQKELAYLLGLDPSTVSSWINGRYSPNFPYPSMTTFLNVCNMLDLNPQNYFILDLEAYEDA